MNKDSTAFLRLMDDSFRKISNYINNMSFDEFLKDEKTQSAILMQMQVIGEMAKKVPEDIKIQIAIPWKNMTGFRDVISHEYFGLDLRLIWESATEHAPQAEKEIKKYLNI
jgi:uncharacterized protein with HEPN domain